MDVGQIQSRFPVTGFGASDCNCAAHLFRQTGPEGPDMRRLLAEVSGVDVRDIEHWHPPAAEADGCGCD